MTFTYAHNARAQWWFDSPNHLATVLGMALLVLAGATVWTLRRFPKPSWSRMISMMGLGSGLGGLTLALLRTYSRGGWVAFVAGLGVFLFSLGKWRRVPILMLSIFLALCALVPNVTERADPGVLGEDQSVGHRILVWRGALAMTADHWSHGVGLGRFGEEFTPWYQPPRMNTRYFSAINNFLTLSAEGGIFALWGYLGLVLGVLWIAWREARQHQNAWMLGVLGAQVVYLVAGLFTNSLMIWKAAWPFWMLFAISAWPVSKKAWNMRPSLRNSTLKMSMSKIHRIKTLLRSLAPPLLASTLICLLVLLGGLRLLAELPTRAEMFTFRETRQNQPGVIVRPTKEPVQGVLLWSHGKGGSIREDGRDTLRYLAEKGFIVVSVDHRNNLMDGLEDLRALLKWALRQKEFESQPIYLAGFSLGAHLSILTACDESDPRLKAAASIGSAAEWPFPEISPADHLYDLKCPLLIIHGEEDHVNSVANAYQLEKLCKRYRKPYEIFIVKGASHHLDEDDQWFTALDRIAEFMKKHP